MVAHVWSGSGETCPSCFKGLGCLLLFSPLSFRKNDFSPFFFFLSPPPSLPFSSLFILLRKYPLLRFHHLATFYVLVHECSSVNDVASFFPPVTHFLGDMIATASICIPVFLNRVTSRVFPPLSGSVSLLIVLSKSQVYQKNTSFVFPLFQITQLFQNPTHVTVTLDVLPFFFFF